jgi:alpha-tubulin suppressor-like RCC1 family protein
MSLRQMFAGSIVKPGFNPLAAPTPTYTYYLYDWGNNANGALGLGNLTSYSSPKQVGSLTDWSKLSAGSNFAVSIKTDGTLWSWGYNGNGQLGLGNRTYYSSPKQVGSLTAWSKIDSASRNSVLAIKTDGTLWSWGQNNYGQLGLGNTTNYSSPKQVGALTTWASISKGHGYFALAIQTNGTLWSWGYNSTGNLGLGNITNYSSPKQIGALTTWSSVQTGQNSTFAIKTDGTLWSWGYSGFGNLGLGNTTDYSSPKQVGSLTNWLRITASYYGAIAIKTDGTLWSWGQNAYGQLGLGNTTRYSSPKQVGALTNWLNVTSGYLASILSTKTDGTLWSWGYNAQGQLGLGNRTYYSSPKQVGALTTWSSVTIGTYSAYALAY